MTTKRRTMRTFRDKPVGVEAVQLVTGNRQESYGDPLMNYERQAMFVTAILQSKLKPGETVSRREAMHIQVSLKQCRDLTSPLRDNEVDICGYAHLLQMEREDQERDKDQEDREALDFAPTLAEVIGAVDYTKHSVEPD
jgi:hypothetical protein